MKKENIANGRVNQKLKTQKRILDTARKMLLSKKDFSLEDVAAQMQISRATIYRYYGNIDMLCLDVAIATTNKDPEDFSSYVSGMDMAQSLFYVQEYFNHMVQTHETELRKYLSLALDRSVKGGTASEHRGGRQPKILEIVMRPFYDQIGKENYDNLKHVATVLCGPEPLIVNKDVNGLNNEQSNEVLRWALEMILKGMEADRRDRDV